MAWKARAKKDPDADPCSAITVYMPKSLSEALDDASVKFGVPKSRLICYAIDNELDAKEPFNYPVEIPEAIYVEHAYASEAERILNYLRLWRGGVGRDMLVLARRDIGIEDREELLLGFRDAVMSGAIAEEPPPQGSKFKHWKPGYLFARIRSIRAATATRKGNR